MTVTATTAVPTSASTASAQGGTTDSAVLSSDFQTFLTMLTTQMQNQDPLDPMDSQEFAVQLATFSGVEQQVKTNQLLDNLLTQVGLTNMSDLAGWVGMEARAPAAVAYDGTPVPLDLAPEAGADRAVLAVYDTSGNLVAQQSVSPVAQSVDWAGTASNGSPVAIGTYSFHLISYSGDQQLADTTLETYAPVTEARMENGEVVLLRAGGVEIAASAVTALRTPTGI